MNRAFVEPSPRLIAVRGRSKENCTGSRTCRWSVWTIHSLATILFFFLATALHAASMTVEPRTAAMDEPITITITLEGDLARLDAIDLPLENLVIQSGPSVSSQFEWRNRVTTRQKIFRWVVYAEESGDASVGPVPLDVSGTSVVLPRTGVQILPDPLAGAVSAEDVVRRLVATGRDRIFIFPEIDRTDVVVGEQVVVTWYLYTAESIRDLNISSTPSLREFWIEEIPLADEPTREVQLAGILMQRLPVRRVALFPLQSGRASAGRLVAVAEVMRPIRDRRGFFSPIERRVGRVVLRSQAPELRVRPLPVETRADAVGRFTLRCTPPSVPSEGPVSFDVTVMGEGNLRSAQQPEFAVPPDARVDVQDRGVSVNRSQGGVVMSRTWRFIVLPRRSGPLELPAVHFHAWDPGKKEEVRLECAGRQVMARVSWAMVAQPPEQERSSEPPEWPVQLIAAFVALLLAGGAVIFFWRRRSRRSSPTAIALMQQAGDPGAMRTAIHEVIAREGLSPEALFRDASELGETFRTLQSLIDIRERETLTADRSPEELRRRAREFGRELDRVLADRARERRS
ncbi:MAG TPA: BatD family protein [Thermoanaerobaculia bacterium]|nr:BatD family protein [Thermoanaerobaculia bacterium]